MRLNLPEFQKLVEIFYSEEVGDLVLNSMLRFDSEVLNEVLLNFKNDTHFEDGLGRVWTLKLSGVPTPVLVGLSKDTPSFDLRQLRGLTIEGFHARTTTTVLTSPARELQSLRADTRLP